MLASWTSETAEQMGCSSALLSEGQKQCVWGYFWASLSERPAFQRKTETSSNHKGPGPYMESSHLLHHIVFKVYARTLSRFSRVRLFVASWTCTLPGSSVHGILQARILKWVHRALFQGIFLTQRWNPGLWHWQECSLPLALPGKP